ncbi:DUF7003 family protein [Burkholderia pseudomultivorans]|uniref:DUF7003 family protein n=1 Tax=Burkholderia pseudomultivorans TaxID=1207504 RepID=UPI00075DFE54|nr:hypothetical protein [Burkholderia pseudomultivorans]KWF06330.1 hypothetical protein WT55_20755 [Burkholderia pseudomultivorans]
MTIDGQSILSVLDDCCEQFSFPMLDNGYVYLAATRLSLYGGPEDWALAIEVFGHSPRAGLPDTQVYTFGSRLVRQRSADQFVSEAAYDAWLAANAHTESAFAYPVEAGAWIDPAHGEYLAAGRHAVRVRGMSIDTPEPGAYAGHGIVLVEPPAVRVFEFCRFLAAVARDSVLATEAEQRACVPADCEKILQLDAWHHPDVVNGERPSGDPTFRSLADVLVTGDAARYRPSAAPNTHWGNWPDGGTL